MGGRTFVLNVSLNRHTKIHGQISNHRFSHCYSKTKVFPKRMAFPDPKGMKQKCKQPRGIAISGNRSTDLEVYSGCDLSPFNP